MTEEADGESSRRVAPQSERSSYIRIAAQQLTIAQQRHTLARVERESRAEQRNEYIMETRRRLLRWLVCCTGSGSIGGGGFDGIRKANHSFRFPALTSAAGHDF